MSETVETVNRWSEAWAGLAWAVTWQSALLVSLAALVAVFLRRSPPGLRYWLWQIVAIKVLLMPFWTVAVPMPFLPASIGLQQAAIEDRGGSMPLAEEGSARISELDFIGLPRPVGPLPPPSPWTMIRQICWQSWLLLGWIMVIVAQFAVLAWQRAGLRGLLREAAFAPEPVHALVGELAGQLGLRRPPAAVVTDADCSFFACGAWRPVLVLPKNLLATLDDGRLRQVLLHELAHVKRLDLILGWPVEIARRLYFFHPLVHWLAYRIRLERELACDQVAMAASGRSPSDYLHTLIHVVTQASQPPALKAAADAASKAHLSTFWKRRLAMLHATHRSNARLGRGVALLLLMTAGVVWGLPTLRSAVAETEKERPAAGLQPRTQIPAARGPKSPTTSELPYAVKFEQGATRFLNGDKITVVEVRGTADKFTSGNIYWIKGTYTLASHGRATLAAYTTAMDAADGTSTPLKVQSAVVTRGNGTFTLFLPMSCRGWPHVSFYPADGGEGFGGNYFGTGDSVLNRWWGARETD